MSPEERERSYEHYKQWQINKNRYKHECVAYVLIVGVVALFVLLGIDNKDQKKHMEKYSHAHNPVCRVVSI